MFRLARDMQDQADMPLIDTEDKITFCLSNLMLTGTATPYLHNGIMSADLEDATNFEVRKYFTYFTLKGYPLITLYHHHPPPIDL